MNLSDSIKNLPHKPGIYKFFNKKSKLIYIGKAIDLKKRVGSYFKNSSNLLPKTRSMISQIEKMEIVVVESEIEALLLEAELIKTHLPKYNHVLKDDKSYLYIFFTKEVFPRVLGIRKNQIKEKGTYFGPFPNGLVVRRTLKELRKIFPYRSCSQNRFCKKEVCLYYHLGLCQGPCEGKINEEKYQEDLNYLKLFLKRQNKKLITDLKKEMKEKSEEEKFEEAGKIRDRIERLEYLRTQFRQPDTYIESPNLIEDLRKQTLLNLQMIFKLLSLPHRIEGYDISNFQGKEATGSMVVFTDGEADKKEYRRFRIKLKDTPDDYAMMKEVLKRRFASNNETNQSWALPDLILIDGGQGQLSTVTDILQKSENEKVKQIPVISIAKKEEEVYFSPLKTKSLSVGLEIHKLKLSKRGSELQLLQQIRDEAHRFAITYHRKLREKKYLA